MASSINAHRAVSVGLSGGIGVGLPLAAVAATWSLSDAGEVVRAGALPFAVGALAGVGLLALSDRLLDRRAARIAAEEAEAASFASAFTGAEAVAPHTAQEAPLRAAKGKRFAHRGAPKGVPVIARAVDALDEADAWAEIDAMLNDDSPISCDPARSKDMYEIALDELRRAESARTGRMQPVAEAAPAQTFAPAVQPVATGVFGGDFDLDEVEETSARAAAMASLYGTAAVTQYPTPVVESTVSAPESSVSAAPSVAVADYSGHEATWAAAFAILDEDAAPAPAPAPASVPVSPSETAYVAPGRMAAVAEGGAATREHAHVNTLLEEEFDRVSSPSVRRTGREFLRVIQGGTATMPRLQAQQA